MSADDVWDEAARQAASQKHPPSEFDPAALEREIGGITSHFLREVWGRHRASLEAIIRLQPTESFSRTLGDSRMQLMMESDGRYKFCTRVGSADFCVWPDGWWGYYIESGEDYIAARCVFGYDESGQFFAETQAPISINVSPHLLPGATAHPLAQCVYAEW